MPKVSRLEWGVWDLDSHIRGSMQRHLSWGDPEFPVKGGANIRFSKVGEHFSETAMQYVVGGNFLFQGREVLFT